MINRLFDLSRIRRMLSGCKERTKKRISYKPELELLRYKFTLRADGVRVFLILPPEFQIRQGRSQTTEFLPGTE